MSAKIPGFQVVDTKISELPTLKRAYITVIIEVKGCRFAGSVELSPGNESGDPFANARSKAIKQALATSERSDLQLYGRSSGGGYRGSGFKKGGGGRQNPDSPASPGQVKRLYAIAKDCGVSADVVRKTLANRGLKEDSLTVGQVNEFIGKMQANKGVKA